MKYNPYRDAPIDESVINKFIKNIDSEIHFTATDPRGGQVQIPYNGTQVMAHAYQNDPSAANGGYYTRWLGQTFINTIKQAEPSNKINAAKQWFDDLPIPKNYCRL